MTRTKLRDSVSRMNAEVCDQCGKCPSACPVTTRIEGFNPRQIIAKLSLGKEVELMESGVIWTCTSCLKCKERCPEEISPYEVILELRREAIAEGYQHPTSYGEAEKTVTETGVIQQPQIVRTRSRERRDRASFGLPPAQKPRDQIKFTEAINELKKETES
ncbi:MAG: 4Fe-4S dicluster domain-containing protein [Candidatus Bathyarchaeota archaeon]|nr:4Fe-4S dicluster domain-containing protein [Candidatus Bathyarchaeota archaeon]